MPHDTVRTPVLPIHTLSNPHRERLPRGRRPQRPGPEPDVARPAQPKPTPTPPARRGVGRAGFILGGLLLLVGHFAVTSAAVLVATGHLSVDLHEAFDDGPAIPRIEIDLSAIGVPSEPERNVVYLNREGALLVAGDDDSRENASSVVEAAGLESVEVPAFRGSAARWDGIKKCVREQFAAYDIDIVDRRPVDSRYVMVMVGGKAGELQTAGHAHERLNGLGPLGDDPIHDAVAFVFSRTLKERTQDVCNTIAHEIGHAYGLDHTRDCKDLMSYRKCGPKHFRDTDALCGEHSARECHDGSPTQNSHEELQRVLGPKDLDLIS